MKKHIGIGKRKSSRWHEITFLFFNTITILTIWTPITKAPSYHYYPSEEAELNFTEDELNSFKWVFRFKIGD